MAYLSSSVAFLPLSSAEVNWLLLIITSKHQLSSCSAFILEHLHHLSTSLLAAYLQVLLFTSASSACLAWLRDRGRHQFSTNGAPTSLVTPHPAHAPLPLSHGLFKSSTSANSTACLTLSNYSMKLHQKAHGNEQ